MAETNNKRKAPSKRKPAPRSSSAEKGQRPGSSLGTTRMQPSEGARRRTGAASGAGATRRSSTQRTRSSAAPTSRRNTSYRSERAEPSSGSQQGEQASNRPGSARQEKSSGLSQDVRRATADPRKPAAASGQAAAQGFFTGKRRIAIIGVAVAIVLIIVISLASTVCQADRNKLNACEQWRGTIRQACLDCQLDEQWVDTLIALMAVESGGDVDVQSVAGVQHDIMQAAEGKYGKIVKNGSKKYKVDAQTPEASIYAGVKEFQNNYNTWKEYLNGIGVSEYGEIQLLVQGYNFGSEGWYKWCKKNNVTSYTVEKAQEYSDTQMPEEAKGTPTHAEKWLKFYEMLR